MMQPQAAVGRDGNWWVPGLVSTLLLPVWGIGFVVVNVIATLAKFGDTGCDDGSGSCMGPGHTTWVVVLGVMGVAALASVASWLVPRRRQLRGIRWSLVGVSAGLGLVVQVIAASTPSH